MAHSLDAAEKEQLRCLLRLARDKARENHRLLQSTIADLFAEGDGGLGDHTLTLTAEILWRAVHDLEMLLREELANRLLKLVGVPQGIAGLLADTTLEIGRETLARHAVVRDERLVEAARHRAFEFQTVEARHSDDRPGGAAPTAIEAGDRVHDLLQEDDAVLALRTRAYLVEQAKRVDRFQRPVLARAELATDPTLKMLWWVAATVRMHVLAQPAAKQAIDAGQLDDLVEDAVRTLGRRIAADTDRNCAVDDLAARLGEMGELSHDFLLDVLEQGHTGLFIAGLAQLCRLDRQAARRMVFDEAGEPLVLACRAAGFTLEEFEVAYRYTRLPRHRARGEAIVQELSKLYQALSQKTALRSLAFWNRNREYLSALDRL